MIKYVVTYVLGFVFWYAVWAFSAWEFPLPIETWASHTRAFFLLEGLVISFIFMCTIYGMKILSRSDKE